MKETELKLIAEVIKNSRRSDRQLARAIGVSQPTISRTLKKLDKEAFLKEYTAIPDIRKLGVEIVAFTFGTWSSEKIKDYPEKERIEEAKKFIAKHPNVIFASSGRGLGMTRMIVTVHKNYSDYEEFMRDAETEWGGLLTRLESFTLSVRTDMITAPFSLTHLMDYIRQEK
jgi:DNA-binding Lrp family transcriptional regulator